VLKVGAVPAEDTLLCLPALAGSKTRIGINLDGPHRYRDFDILRADANRMSCFSDECLDTVLCNSVLEHDKHFWLNTGPQPGCGPASPGVPAEILHESVRQPAVKELRHPPNWWRESGFSRTSLGLFH
jgi:hypothetical protein